MAFNKTADCDSAKVLDDKSRIHMAFAAVGKDSVTELELARAAKTLGFDLKGIKLKDYCDEDERLALRLR